MESKLSPFESEGEDSLSPRGGVDVADDGGGSPVFDEEDFFKAEK